MKRDESYRLLFSNPEVVADLLRGYVSPQMSCELDFSTLERVNASFVSEELERRESDIIWKLQMADRTLYVYLLLEFQSRPDRWMALRMFEYLALLYGEIQKGPDVLSDGRLPPVLPVVLYKGVDKWRHPRNMKELVALPEGFPPGCCPDVAYLLIDENDYVGVPVSAEKNLVNALFALENGRDARHIESVIETLLAWLPLPEQDGIRRAFAALIGEIATSHGYASGEISGELVEVRGMLEQRIEQWKEQWKKEAREEGLAEGREEGREEHEARGIEKGRREERLQMARAMKAKGVDAATISEFTGLSAEEIEKLS